MRPLWLLGMILYMFVFALILSFYISRSSSLSQLIGSTLALEYMRAGVFLQHFFVLQSVKRVLEYVAPLGSTSLVFNFLFARFLVGTPVTNTDIYVCPSPFKKIK